MSTREIRVKLFAGAREAVGSAEVAVFATPETTAGELLDLLVEEFPDAAEILRSCRVAVEREFAADGSVVPKDAEVALIPPVSGG